MLAAPTMIPTLASGDEEFMFIALGGILAFVIFVIAGTVRSVLRDRAREESRREIAAYVAEGTMSPADAERLIEAGVRNTDRPGHNGRVA